MQDFPFTAPTFYLSYGCQYMYFARACMVNVRGYVRRGAQLSY